MYDKQKVIDWALAQVGYHEEPGNRNKYAKHLDSIPGFYNGKKDGFAWCDVFVDDGFVVCYGVAGAKELLCQPDYSAGAGCAFSAGYFRAKGRFHTGKPETGDQIVVSYAEGEVSHTGIVVEVTGYSVVTVEGNTSDGVYKRSYPLSDGRICGYGRPDWAAGTVDEQDTTPPAQSAASPCAGEAITGLPMLREGDKGETVRAAQILLIGRGFRCGPWGADGDFGSATFGAVYWFQQGRGLEQDGIIGPKTWAALLGVS